jgi:hypothetical protein
MNGGSCPPCYSRDHGHPPGEGAWIREAIAELMRITREEGRRYSPDFALSMEDPGELYLPQLDTYISRANDVIGWPAVGPGSEVVPAFFYVYGDLMPSTNVDIQHTCRPDDLVLLRTARAFITGAGLSTQLTPWQVLADYGEDDLFPTPEKMDTDQLTLLRNCVSAREGVLRSYLRDGQLLPQPSVGPPQPPIRTQHQTGTTTEDVEVPRPAVLVGAWKLDEGTAYAYVNVTRSPVHLGPAEGATWGTGDRGAEAAYANGERVEGVAFEGLTVPALGTLVVECKPGA